MKMISIPYGKEQIEIRCAEKNIMDVIYPKATPHQGSANILRKSIENPVDGGSLRDFLATTEPVLCIVNDATRPTRTSAVLHLIKEEIRDRDIHFLVATGAHRAPSDAELKLILDTQYSEHHANVLVHDARDEESVAYFGKTRYGNELWLNKALKDHGRILVISSVEPHYFAGFTGGRKSILPGVAAYRTIEQNHKHALNAEAKPLSLTNNPIHEEMIDCMNLLSSKRLFSLQMVLDKEQNIYAAYTGSIDRTFEMATRIAINLYRAEVPARADIVVTVAQKPFDVNLYQTLKAIEHGRLALRSGGILIVISACPEGLGPSSFSRLFRDRDSLGKAALNANICYKLGDHNASNLFNLARQNEIWAITTIQKETLSNARIRTYTSGQEALDQALKNKGEDASVLFMLNGCLTVPRII